MLADALSGTRGADNLLGLGGKDSLAGLDGNDVLDGGAGTDRAALQGADPTLALHDFPVPGVYQTLENIEIIDLTCSADYALHRARLDVLNMSENDNTLRVDGDEGDSLPSLAQGWTAGALVTLDATQYQTNTSGAARLLVDVDMAATIS